MPYVLSVDILLAYLPERKSYSPRKIYRRRSFNHHAWQRTFLGQCCHNIKTVRYFFFFLNYKNVFLCTKTKYAVLLLIPFVVYYGWLTLTGIFSNKIITHNTHYE